MPVHDWTRVDAGVFHSFHNAWIAELTKALNSGLLPPDFYALGEQIAGTIGPDVLSLRIPADPLVNGNGSRSTLEGAIAVSTIPPQVRFTLAEDEMPVRKLRVVTIRHVSGHQVVALIEIVSPGNKSSIYAMEQFLKKAAGALQQGVHLLIIDLFPPGTRDPQGLHAAFWEYLLAKTSNKPFDKPLTLAAYAAAIPTTAYIEPVAVGDELPAMPLFLAPDRYINAPLGPTYDAAYAGVPRYYRDILDAE